MKTAIVTLLFALLAIAVLAKAPQKPVIVSYPNDTPDSVLTEAKDAVRAAGGVITHEYKLIKAFAAKASFETLETVRALGQKHNALIEDDQMVHANDNAF